MDFATPLGKVRDNKKCIATILFSSKCMPAGVASRYVVVPRRMTMYLGPIYEHASIGPVFSFRSLVCFDTIKFLAFLLRRNLIARSVVGFAQNRIEKSGRTSLVVAGST